MRHVYRYFLQYHPETGLMSLGTHYRVPIKLPLVNNTGLQAGDSEELIHLVEFAFVLCGIDGVHTHQSKNDSSDFDAYTVRLIHGIQGRLACQVRSSFLL